MSTLYRTGYLAAAAERNCYAPNGCGLPLDSQHHLRLCELAGNAPGLMAAHDAAIYDAGHAAWHYAARTEPCSVAYPCERRMPAR